MLEALALMGLGYLVHAIISFCKGEKDEAQKSFKSAVILLTIAAASALMLCSFAPQLGMSNGL